MPKKGKPWVEQRGNSYLVRQRVKGKKVTIETCDTEEEARWYADSTDIKTHFDLVQRRARQATQGMGIGAFAGVLGSSTKKPTRRLAEYAYDLIESDPNIEVTSRSAYRNTVKNHVENSIIDIPIDRLVDDPALLRKYWVNLEPMKSYAAGGGGMKASVHRVLTKVFTQAVRDRVIPTSPMSMANIKRPIKKAAIPREPLTIGEVEELADACLNERDRLMILIDGYCGLRGGEVGGLRQGTWTQRRAASASCRRSEGRAATKHLGLPKGDKTRRITVPCSLAREVARYGRKNAGSDGRIFHTEGGLLGSRRTTLVSQAAAARSEFRPVNFHLLRRTTASLLVDDGASIKDVQEYLGIATAAIPLDTYAHAFEGRDQSLADRLESRRRDYRDRLKKRVV